MKCIIVPEDKLINTKSGQSQIVKFLDFLDTILFDTKLGKTSKDIYTVVKLKSLFKSSNPGDKISIEDTDYEKILEVVLSPSQPYNVEIMSQCYEFISSIEDAR